MFVFIVVNIVFKFKSLPTECCWKGFFLLKINDMNKKIDIEFKPDNPRKWAKKGDERRLEESMEKFGDLGCIVWNENTKNLVGGNRRGKLLKIKEAIEEGRIEIVGENKKVDKQGTKAWGYVKSVGKDGEVKRFAFRWVRWSKEWEDEACLLANKLGGVFDDEKLMEFFDRKLLASVGFDMNLMDRKLRGMNIVEGSVEFSQFLGEEMNYVVLVFETKIDWLNAVSRLGLKKVGSKYANGKTHQIGWGRLVDGVKVMEMIKIK